MKYDELIIRPFKADDIKAICPDIASGWPEVNETTGPALTVISKKYGEVLMCGGVRIYGLGEAWTAFSQRAREHYQKSVFQKTLVFMNKVIQENNLWRLVASAKEDVISAPNFLKHLGFIETHPGLYVHQSRIKENKDV